MNVLQNLVELYNHLPQESTHRCVAKAILENLQQLQNATIYNVAELSNASRTTVWSMVQKMGYRSFSEFRHALANCISQYAYYNRILKPEGGTPAKSEGCTAFLVAEEQRLRDTAQWIENLDPALIEERVMRIHACDRISFYLPFRVTSVASFQQNLAMDGKQTGYFCLLPEMLADAQELDENSLVLISTLEYAETIDLSPVFEAAGAHGAEIWLLSSTSRYQHLADWMLMEVAPKLGRANILDPFLQVLSEWYRVAYLQN